MQEDVAALGMTALLVPEEDGVLTNDVGIIQDAQNVAEQLQQLAVLVAVYLQNHQSNAFMADGSQLMLNVVSDRQ